MSAALQPANVAPANVALLDREEIAMRVAAAWRSALPDGQLEGAFFDQGGSSLAAVMLVVRLEEELGVALPFAVLVTAGGAAGIVDWIWAQCTGGASEGGMSAGAEATA